MHGRDRDPIKVRSLAQRAPRRLGGLTIVPAARQLTAAGGSITLRPQVMLVLLALADADGGVVSRDDLTSKAWDGRFVAEDSINGAISEIRRALRELGAKGVELETIPKIGYRLLVPEGTTSELMESGDAPVANNDNGARGATRRWALIGGGAALAGAFAFWRPSLTIGDSPVAHHLDQGLIALRQGLPEQGTHGISAFQAATELDPENSRAWGLLALSYRAAAETAPPQQVEGLRARSEVAARRALALEPGQADARAALVLLEPTFGRWLEAERQLRAILRDAPDNEFVKAGLATLLMSTGQVRKCLEQLQWLNARHPLSPNLQFRRVYTLWSAGRHSESDATADRALQQWPKHAAVWFSRLWTFAFSGRAERALAMLGDAGQRPPMPPAMVGLYEVSLRALTAPSPPLTKAAISANLAAASRGPAPAVAAIMVLSALGEGQLALEVAQGFLLQKGKVMVRQRHTPLQPSVTDSHHRMTMMLWIPATANLRAEPGFKGFCDDLGLATYWTRAGVQPDFMTQAKTV